MKVDVMDSDRRCPHCSKRMMLDIGQDELGRTYNIHSCWSCGYEERPLVVRRGV